MSFEGHMRFKWNVFLIILTTVLLIGCGDSGQIPTETTQSNESHVGGVDSSMSGPEIQETVVPEPSISGIPVDPVSEMPYQRESLIEKSVKDSETASIGGSLVRLGSDPPTLAILESFSDFAVRDSPLSGLSETGSTGCTAIPVSRLGVSLTSESAIPESSTET